MQEAKIFKTEIGGREVVVEIGKYAELSSGSCLIRCGDTVVMTNVAMASAPRPGLDFFPLAVDFEEKMYAVGRIPGGFKKREGRASDKAILTSRLIDRPLRPLFPKGMFNDVAIVSTALSVDVDIAPEVFGMLGSSIALSISDIPFLGPTGSVVVGLINDKFIINPDTVQRATSKLHLVVSGTKDAIMMVEAGADLVTEKEMLDAIMFGHEEIKRQVKFIETIVKAVGKPKRAMEFYKIDEKIDKEVRKYSEKLIEKALKETDREKRQIAQDEAEKGILEHFAKVYPDNTREVKDVLYNITKEIVRRKITHDGFRPDGRKTDEIRQIWSEISVLPRVHGTGVFTRGQSQTLTTCTLGTIGDVQKLDNLDEETYKRYMHQYNFPPYSVGEARPMRAPGRREIGHGALAERALETVIPSEADFPYAIRMVSEILSSNGSTSMASVCGSTLALMDAGVPIKAPVAGIAMGLIQDEKTGKTAILSDIQGLEDFLGDMDFKVAGTKTGISAIQMDIKIKGIDKAILTEALEQARKGRLHILDKMNKTISEPKAELSKYAPKIVSFNIEPDQIGEVIGKGGKTINKIIEDTGVKIDIEEDGTVYIASSDKDAIENAKSIIMSILKDIEVGEKFTGNVTRIMTTESGGEFGAKVYLTPNKDGMIHISKLSNKRVEKVTDVINIGDMVEVEVIKTGMKGVDLKLVKKL
ncbi:MAG: polyribonucleotide nucleotidyltransferase [Firmicutes bacterium]|nr:polyribonucleotide nucleotidyltransferase [Bacillota bacterium]